MWWIWLFWTTINPLLNSGGASYKMIIFLPIVCRPLVFFWFSALFFFGWRLVRTNMRIGTVKGRRREEKGAGRFGWCVFLVEDTHHSLRYGSCPAHIHTTGCAQKNKKRKKEREREPHNVTWTDRPFGVLASCWLFVGILSPTYSFFHPVIMRLSTVTRLGSFAFKGKKTCDSLRRNLSLSGTERKEITNVIGESNRLFFFF